MTKIVGYTRQSGKVKAGCLISILVVILLIAGAGYLAYKKSMEILGEEVTKVIKDDPSIQEHIGDILEMDWNFGATSGRTGDEHKNSKSGEEKATIMVFDVTGSKGKGQIIATMAAEPEEGNLFTAATLEMADGKSYPLVLKQPEPVETPAETPPVEKDDAPKDDAPKDDAPKDNPEPGSGTK